MLSKLPLIFLVCLTCFACNYEPNGDQPEVDEDLFSGSDRSTEPDVTWEDQSARSSVTANSADYDSSGVYRYEVGEDDDTLRYLRTPAIFSTSKDIPNTTGIEGNATGTKPGPLGRDKEYDGTYKDYEPKPHRKHKPQKQIDKD